MKNRAAIKLLKGSHPSADFGLCAMEAVAWLAGEPHSDRPKCTSPVLAAYVRSLNDAMPDEQRQRLDPYLDRLLNTVNPQLDLERAEVLAWAAVTQFAPTALDAVGLVGYANTLRGIKKYDWSAAQSAARSAEYAAQSARYAESAAWYAAWSAAQSAAQSAAWSAEYAAGSATKEDVWGLALAVLDEALNVV